MCYVHVAALVAEYLRRKGTNDPTDNSYIPSRHRAALSMHLIGLTSKYLLLVCRHVQAGLLGLPSRHPEH